MNTGALAAGVPDPMDAPPIRWGVLAPGGIAARFAAEIPAYTRSRIVAVGSRQMGRAQTFVAKNLGGSGVRAYGSYEELVADRQVDAVYVASPHAQHRDHAIMALQAGKHVLVEKAFALSAAQAEEVFAVAAREGLFAMEAMWSRFLPHYHAMRSLVAGGELGEVRMILGVHAQSLNLAPGWRLMNRSLGGGALLDLGVYPLSLFHWLLGVPDRIDATGTMTATGVDLRETITCWYGDRMAVAYDDMAANGRCCLQVVGTAGRLDVADRFYTPQDLVLTDAGGVTRVVVPAVAGGFQFEAAEVARCVAAGLTESAVMSWRDTVEVLRMTDEVRRLLGVTYPG